MIVNLDRQHASEAYERERERERKKEKISEKLVSPDELL